MPLNIQTTIHGSEFGLDADGYPITRLHDGLVRVSVQDGENGIPAGSQGAPRTIGIEGDSRGAQNNASGAAASNGEYNNTQGMWTWADVFSGKRAYFTPSLNKAVGSSQMSGAASGLNVLERLKSSWDNVPLAALLFICDLNDIAADRTAAAICADYETLYAYCKRRGIRLIHVGPYAPSNALSAARSQVLLQVRDYILRAPQRHPHVFTVDAMGILGNATASPPTTPSSLIVDPGGSGFHINGAGAFLLGKEIARIICLWMPPNPSLIASAADTYAVDATTARPNLWDNPMMTGNSGTLGTGANNAPAWLTATAYAAGAMVINGGNAYATVAGGTSGATAPTHVGTVKVDEFGHKYYDPVVASDGTVLWTFVGPGAVAGAPDLMTVRRTNGAGTGYVCTCDRADGVGKDVVLAVTGAGATDTWEMAATSSVSSRAKIGATYQPEAEVAVINASGLNAPSLRTLTTVAGTAVQSRDVSSSTTLTNAVLTDFVGRLRVPAITLPSFAGAPTWDSNTVVPAGAQCVYNGNAYTTTAGGTTGTTPPTHTTGTVSDGGVLWVAAISTCAWNFFPTFGAASARAVVKLGRLSFRRTA